MGSIDVFAICFNEEVLLPFFIAHYKAMGANITIYDNFSTDRSKEIILDSGCKLIEYDSGGQIRDDLYLGIKNEVYKKSKAEFCITCDIDEFLIVPFDPSPYTIINTKGYDMIGMPPSRIGQPNMLYNKAVMFRPTQLKQIGYGPGAHTCKPEGNIVGSREFAILKHYKYISEEYVYARHKMYQSRLSDFNKKYNFGQEYLDPKEQEIKDKFAELRKNAVMVG